MHPALILFGTALNTSCVLYNNNFLVQLTHEFSLVLCSHNKKPRNKGTSCMRSSYGHKYNNNNNNKGLRKTKQNF